MRLYEWEGKQLLAKHDVAVPQGVLWGRGPLPISDTGYVVKAQTLAGQRGLRGGIKFCDDVASADAVATNMRDMTIGGERVVEVYVEERLASMQELYTGIVIDRDTGSARMLLSAVGGVHVESASESVAWIDLESHVKLLPEQIHGLVRKAAVDPTLVDVLGPVLAKLQDVFESEDAEMVEINPLMISRDGQAVAADARVILDDSATFRHSDWPSGGQDGSAFERRCSELGAVGVEMDGGIVAIMSGAGLMMATVDLVVSSGSSLRAAIDLGGLVLREADELADLFDAVLSLEPRAILINAFFQLATCDALAAKLAVGLRRHEDSRTPIVMRLRGRGYDEARALLAPFALRWEPDLKLACQLAGVYSSEVG